MNKPTSKYGALIQKAKENTPEPENQKTILPVSISEDVNLSIKVPRELRQHWAAESKRQGTTLTAAIIAALTERFGQP